MPIHNASCSKPLVALCLLVTLGGARAEDVVLRCSAKQDGIPHTLKLIVADGKVTGFDYSSMNLKYGEDCEVGAREGKESDGGVSEWKRSGDGVVVSVFDPPADAEQHAYQAGVKIEQLGKSYRLTILPDPEPKMCGLHGYIAPVVVLTSGKKKCALSE